MLGKSSQTLTKTLGLEKGTKKTKTTYGSICKSSWNNFCNLNCIIWLFHIFWSQNFRIPVLCQRNKAPTSCSQYSKTKNTLPACLAWFGYFLDPEASISNRTVPNGPLTLEDHPRKWLVSRMYNSHLGHLEIEQHSPWKTNDHHGD